MRMTLTTLTFLLATLTGCVVTDAGGEGDDDDSAVEEVEEIDSALCEAMCTYFDRCDFQDAGECIEHMTEVGYCPVECPEGDEQDVCLEGVRLMNCSALHDGTWPEEIGAVCGDIPLC